jgi:fibronectin type 3 domain-containing protein
MPKISPNKKHTTEILIYYLTLGITLMFIFNGIIIFTPLTSSQQSAKDSFGYRWIDSNVTAPSINYNWTDGVSGSTDLNLGNDQNSGYISLGFTFPFYSGLYSFVAICDNGWATFTDSGYTTSAGNPPPHTSRPNALIAPFWTDLDPSIHGNVTYKRNDLASPKNFIISWNSVPLKVGSNQYNQTFQAILYENGTVLFQYKSINITQSLIPLVGIEDSTGTIGLQYPTSSIINASAVRFFNYFPDHDLNVKSVSVKKFGSVNKDLKIKSVIENFGLKDETEFNVSLLINSKPVNWTGPSINLSTYTSQEISFIWRPTTQGNHTVGIRIENVTGETKTDNNYLSKTVDVRVWRGIVYYDDRHSSLLLDYYQIWYDELKKANIWVENVYSSTITDDALKGYTDYIASYPSSSYSSNEINTLQNFVNSGNGMFILSRYNYTHLFTLTQPYGIIWNEFPDGRWGVYNKIKQHEITNNVLSIDMQYHRANLKVTDAAKGLIHDSDKPKGLKLAISNESGAGRVACFTDPYTFTDWDISQANNRILAKQIMEWVIGDSKPPKRPRNFRAFDGKMGNQVNFTWTANKEIDLNGYFLYRGTSSGVYDQEPVFIPAPASSYKDKGPHLQDHIQYFYKLGAVDEVPNISHLTGEVSATPTDRIPPKTPLNFTITDVGTGSLLNVSWNKNKESDVGEYQLSKSDNFEFESLEKFIFQPNITFYLDTEVEEGNTYFYRLSVIDEVPNESDQTTIKDGTPYDRIAPLQPTGFNVSDPGLGNTIKLIWNHSTDEDLVDYLLERKDEKKNIKKIPIAATNNNGPGSENMVYFDSDDLVDGMTYSYRLYARDDSKLSPPNKSPPTKWFDAAPTDITYPTIPENFTIIDESYYAFTGPVHRLNVSWNISDESDLRGFILYRDTFENFRLTENKILVKLNVVDHYMDYNVEENFEYYYKITAYDEVPNESPASVELIGVPDDVTPPPVPREFKVESLFEGESVKLTWALQPESETEGFIIYYKQNITDEFSLLVQLDKFENQFIHRNLINDNPYYYKLQTIDSIPNYSPFTSVRTATPSDKLPPKKPIGLKIEQLEIGRALKLSWKSNSDEDLNGYRIYREGKLIMSVDKNTTSAIDSGLIDGETYRYNITAIDEVPNESDSSLIKVGVPKDEVAPAIPIGFAATLSEDKDSVVLSWTPSNSSDIEFYHIFRSTNNIDYTLLKKVIYTESIYFDSSVQSGMTYYYRIAASDAEPNVSPRSKNIKIDVPEKDSAQVMNSIYLASTGLIIIIILIVLVFLFAIRPRAERSGVEKNLGEGKAPGAVDEGTKAKEMSPVEPGKGVSPIPVKTITPITPGRTEPKTTTQPLTVSMSVPSPMKLEPMKQLHEPSKPLGTIGLEPEPESEPVLGKPLELPGRPTQEPRPPSLPPVTVGTDKPDMMRHSPTVPEKPEKLGKPETPVEYKPDQIVKPGTAPLHDMIQVSIVKPEEPQKPLPVILIPLDDEKAAWDIQGIKRDKKGRITIVNPKLFNVPRFPLKKPPVGKIIKSKDIQ